MEVEAPKPKPFISANQVTLMRLILIPLPCWLLYGTQREQFAALILATILGCTDFVDGYLARKYGVTVLGSLMDPIADKVFIAITFMPAVDLKWVPAWLVAALMVREFLVTAARTAYEARGQQLKSTYLSRYKTWVQMCGIGLVMIMNTISTSAFDLLLMIGTVLPFLALVLRYVLVRKVWRGAVFFTISFSGLYGLHHFVGQYFAALLMAFIVGVTWVSGLGYLFGIGELAGKGPVKPREVVRLIFAVALPMLAVFAQMWGLAPKWTLIGVVSFEMAHGGLDNLLAHHHAEQGPWAWGGRQLLLTALVGASLVPGIPAHWVEAAAVLAFAVGAVALTWAFWKNRIYYLDSKLGDKARAVSPPVPA